MDQDQRIHHEDTKDTKKSEINEPGICRIAGGARPMATGEERCPNFRLPVLLDASAFLRVLRVFVVNLFFSGYSA